MTKWWEWQDVNQFYEPWQDLNDKRNVIIARGVFECIQEAELYGYYGPEPADYEPVPVEEIIVRPVHKWYGRGLDRRGLRGYQR